MGNRSVGDEEQPRGKSNLTVCHKVYASRRHPKKRIKMPAKTMRRENGVRHKPALIRRAPTAAWIPSPDPSLPAKRGTGNRLRIPGLIARTNPVPGPDSIHYVVPPLRGGMEIDSFMQNPSDGPSRRKKEKEKGRKRQMRRWALTMLLVSFLITALLSLASGEIIEGLPMFASILVLVLFVALGIVFDIIGLAVATADVTAFNSMAARRLKTGKKAVWLISNTEKVSSVCNDVIGDIAGVVSGATGAAIAAQLFSESASGFWLSLTLTSLIAAVTVGGKALGKQYAVRYNEKIVYWVAKLLCGFQK